MSRINQVGIETGTTEDYTDIGIGVRWNKEENEYEMTHNDKYAILIRFYHDKTEAYFLVLLAQPTAGVPEFVEIAKVDKDGIHF